MWSIVLSILFRRCRVPCEKLGLSGILLGQQSRPNNYKGLTFHNELVKIV